MQPMCLSLQARSNMSTIVLTGNGILKEWPLGISDLKYFPVWYLINTKKNHILGSLTEKVEIADKSMKIIMDSSLSDKKRRLDDFDRLYGQDLDMGQRKDDSKLRLALYDGFDREMSLAEKSFARGNYLDALEHREKANRVYTSLKNARL